MTDLDVLIIGGGPTGLTLGLELAMNNISFRIIDKVPVRSDKSRALAIQPRTLELLNRHGVANSLVENGTTGTGIRIFVNRKPAGQLDMSDLGLDDTAFPLPLWISQDKTEQFLDEALLGYNHKVERPFTAETVEQDESGVDVTIRGSDGVVEKLRCRYVVGCDGAHSIVRHAANIAFEGAPYLQDFILADVHLTWSHAGSPMLTFLFGRGILIGFPLKDGVFRLVASRPGGIDQNSEPTLEDFQKIFDTMAPGSGKLHDATWITRFHLHHRVAAQYSAGRLFVAGDAAHIHSPAGGQGMNTGIQDAINLGWKISAVISGTSSAEQANTLLDSYSIERRKIGQHLLKGTDRAFTIGSSQNPFFTFFRNLLIPWVLPWLFSDRARRARIFRFTSQLGIRYRQSPVVGMASEYQGSLKGGDRAPDEELRGSDYSKTSLTGLLKGPGHLFLIFEGNGGGSSDGDGDVVKDALRARVDSFSKMNANWVKSRTIYSTKEKGLGKDEFLDKDGKLHARYGFLAPGYVLVRPDAYISHIGPLTAMDEFVDWLKGYMTPTTTK